jgi:hypothetical protein
VKHDKQKQQRYKEMAKVAGKAARKDLKKSKGISKKYNKSQQKGASLARRAVKARKRLKLASKNTEAAAIAKQKADKKFAKMKMKHALGQLKPDPPKKKGSKKKKGKKAKGKKKGKKEKKLKLKLGHPGIQLAVRVAASKKTVADLEFKKARQIEKAAQTRAALLTKEAAQAKKKNGIRALKAAKEARIALKTAAKDQVKANRVFRREEKKIASQDRGAQGIVAKIMRSKTGVTKARRDARKAQASAQKAQARARRDVRKARVVSLKLRNAIDRSSKAIAAMDSHMARSMKLVLPAERKDAGAAWKTAKKANKKLLRFRKAVAAGRKAIAKLGRKERTKLSFKHRKVERRIEHASSKIRKALRAATKASKLKSSKMRVKPSLEV